MIEGAARWKQRHDNLEQVVALLNDAVEERRRRNLSQLEQAGLIQRFEIAWELSWKLMADCLRALGSEPQIIGPKPIIRQAFAAGLIADGQAWIDASLTRNMLSHTYNAAKAEQAVEAISTQYLALMHSLVEITSDENWLGNTTDPKGT